jgi:hypothetical protein
MSIGSGVLATRGHNRKKQPQQQQQQQQQCDTAVWWLLLVVRSLISSSNARILATTWLVVGKHRDAAAIPVLAGEAGGSRLPCIFAEPCRHYSNAAQLREVSEVTSLAYADWLTDIWQGSCVCPSKEAQTHCQWGGGGGGGA